jgi:hypothetical protein
MGTRTICLGLLLTAGLALTPAPAWCQPDGGGQDLDYSPPDPIYPLPLYHDRPEKGGFYFAGQFLLWRQTNPIKDQPIAVRGFVDTNGGVQATQNFLTDVLLANPGPPVMPRQVLWHRHRGPERQSGFRSQFLSARLRSHPGMEVSE